MTEYIGRPGTIWDAQLPSNTVDIACQVTRRVTPHSDYVLEDVETHNTYTVKRRCRECMTLRRNEDGTLARILNIPPLKDPKIREVYNRAVVVSKVFSEDIPFGSKSKRFFDEVEKDLRKKDFTRLVHYMEDRRSHGTNYGFYVRLANGFDSYEMEVCVLTWLYASNMTEHEKSRGAVSEIPASSRIKFFKGDREVREHYPILPLKDGVRTFLPLEIYILKVQNIDDFMTKVHSGQIELS